LKYYLYRANFHFIDIHTRSLRLTLLYGLISGISLVLYRTVSQTLSVCRATGGG